MKKLVLSIATTIAMTINKLLKLIPPTFLFNIFL